jgi:chromosome segregation ATPase
METLNFVLGALSGLFLVGIVYAFIGVLKMSKQIKDLKEEVQSINQSLSETHRTIDEKTDTLWTEVDSRFTHTHRLIDDSERDLNQELDRRFEEIQRHSDYLATEINSKIDETTKYIDSRIDKTIDALCLRMDAKIEIKRHNPEEGD